jgi:hypothetical protein
MADPAVALVVAGTAANYGGIASVKFESFENCEKFVNHVSFVKTPPGSTYSIPGTWKPGGNYNPMVFAICIPEGKDMEPVQANLKEKGLYNP